MGGSFGSGLHKVLVSGTSKMRPKHDPFNTHVLRLWVTEMILAHFKQNHTHSHY